MGKRVIIAAVIVFAVLAVLSVAWIVWHSPTETDQIASYALTLRRLDYPDHEGIAFFPAELPADAVNARFFYQPGMLQGGTTLHLSFQADDAALAAYAAQFAAAADLVCTADAVPDAILSHRFLRDLPDSATVYILYAKPYLEGSWNHGESRIVAIYGSRILFQYDRW